MKISLTKFFKEVRGHSSNAPDMMSALTRWGIPFDAVPAEVEEHAKGKGRGGVQHGDIVDIKYLPAAKRAYRAEKAAKDALAAARAPADRPYVIANFVASLDGRATFQGRSGALGDEAGAAR